MILLFGRRRIIPFKNLYIALGKLFNVDRPVRLLVQSLKQKMPNIGLTESNMLDEQTNNKYLCVMIIYMNITFSHHCMHCTYGVLLAVHSFVVRLSAVHSKPRFLAPGILPKSAISLNRVFSL
jgi:hypothetical protein